MSTLSSAGASDNINRSLLIKTENKPRYKKGPVDIPFVVILLVLLVFGIVMMFSAGYAWAINEDHPGDYYLIRQVLFASGGLIVAWFISHIDYRFYKKKWILITLSAVTLIMLILCRFGPLTAPKNGSWRWLNVGFDFQPSEIAKFAVVVLFAYFISENYKKMKRFTVGVIPFAIVLAVTATLLMIQPHLSATIIICCIGAVMMLIGGTRIGHLLILIIVGAAALLCVIYIMYKMGYTYFYERLNSMVNTMDESAAETWQTRQSLIAIGSGGWFGLGLGNSRQKFMYLPESKNDFVYAIVCEELGFIGALAVIILFLLFILRGFYIAKKAPDKFGMMLAVGLTFQIGLQALLNIAVVTNTIPNTGISLPFFSYGGTALIMQLAQMGIILNVSRQSLIET
ncbi:MAG: putative lipid II flippase FtsW [Ruminococcus sp.]|jgi:cell division protein FtsW|nr:putative lipid II flippase FtsW [Ruminococcus sp.]